MPKKILCFGCRNYLKIVIASLVSGLIVFYATTKNRVNAASTIEVESEAKLLRYGTYVPHINETCLRNKCIYDELSPDIWSSKKILVTAKKFLGNVHNYISSNDISDQNLHLPENKTFELLLTPPIITLWVYELAFALSEGS